MKTLICRSFLIILTILLPIVIKAQEMSRYKCAYDVNIQLDTITKKILLKDIYMVQINNDITKGFYYRNFYYDSLMTKNMQLHNQIRQLELREVGKDPETFKQQIAQFVLFFRSIHYKNYQKKEIKTIDNIVANKFVFTEELKPQDWEIQSDTMTVLGYHSQKATCHYRGRDWIAWFTNDIPLSEGPWKFYGLPGLITKVEDDKGHYSFTLTGFQEIEEPMDTKISNKVEKTTREEFVKLLTGGELLRSILSRAGEIIGLPSNGSSNVSKRSSLQYDYIETDYKEWGKEK